jgi:hypothetical protein
VNVLSSGTGEVVEMGMVKNHIIEWDELGLCGGKGGPVCGQCIGDSVLAEFISKHAYEESCSYCGREEDRPFASDMADVVEFMAKAINEVWTDPANELMYITREGGYQGKLLSGWEVLDEAGFEPACPKVFEDVASCFMGRDWCRSDYYATTPAERHRWGWERFCREVMYSRRYTFWSSLKYRESDDYQGDIPPGVMLAALKEVINQQGLIREFPAGKEFWRVRDHQRSESLAVPNAFTSPPVEFAVQPNRMSPAGISMFYGSDDFDTAVLEVAGQEACPGMDASGIALQSCRPFQLLDLIQLGSGWSFFAPDGRDRWHRSEFLRYFTKPQTSEHFSELRKYVRAWGGIRGLTRRLDGVGCQALAVASVVGFLSGNGLPKTSRSAALVSDCFQIDVLGLYLQTIAYSKKGGRQLCPVQQAIDSLASMTDDLAWHMNDQVQKRAKLHRQQSCAFSLVL